MSRRGEEAVKKEPASLFCNHCREWVPSPEKHNMFESVDGAKQAVSVWTCPRCRKGENA